MSPTCRDHEVIRNPQLLSADRGPLHHVGQRRGCSRRKARAAGDHVAGWSVALNAPATYKMGCPTACRCGPYSKPPRPGARRPTPMDGRPAAEGVDGVDIAQGRRAWRQIILLNGAIHL